jgi:hypothetical protein
MREKLTGYRGGRSLPSLDPPPGVCRPSPRPPATSTDRSRRPRPVRPRPGAVAGRPRRAGADPETTRRTPVADGGSRPEHDPVGAVWCRLVQMVQVPYPFPRAQAVRVGGSLIASAPSAPDLARIAEIWPELARSVASSHGNRRRSRRDLVQMRPAQDDRVRMPPVRPRRRAAGR